MAFGFFERSRSKGRKIELYLFQYGPSASSYYAFTNHTSAITVSGKTYQPVPIKRGKIVVKGNLDKAKLEIRTSLALEIAEIFRIYPPSYVVRVTISERHLSDPDNETRMIWGGRVLAASREGRELVMSCEPVRTSTRRMGLRRYYQRSCSHILFSTPCGASKSAATVSATVASISGNSVTLNPGWTSVASRFVAGTLEWTNAKGDPEVRAIMSISGNTLTLSAIPRDITVGMTVSPVMGCPRTAEGCAAHNNILNFGGCRYIPKKNPVGTTSVFY